jgi:metal-dependent hydrolase (beta-lactamase superfamily II)
MGGFHLAKPDERVEKTIEFFDHEGITRLLPSHCTDPSVICRLSQFFEVKWVSSGNVFRF